jgi:UDP-glucuronate 4-epimerase
MTSFRHRMRVLVTGGAGFIGSHLVDSLLSSGTDVTVLDNFDAFYERAVKERNIRQHRDHPRWRLIEGDLRDRTKLPATLEVIGPFDAVVHLAAKVAVRPSIENSLTYQDVNILGTQNLLEIARRMQIPQFVFASSSSVYGVNPRVPWKEDDAVLQPISPYASTKVSGELLGHVYSHLHGIRFIALRFFTVYGPRQRPDLVIHKFARLIASGRAIPVFGDGSTRRDYTYVDDVVAGVRAALTYNRSAYEVINIGNTVAVTLLEMIRALERGLGLPATIEWLPEQPGDVPQTWASVAKARELLGYDPRTPFDEGVKRFAAWFVAEFGTSSAAALMLER